MRLIMHPAFYQGTGLAKHLFSWSFHAPGRSLETLQPVVELCTHLVMEKEPTMRIRRPFS